MVLSNWVEQHWSPEVAENVLGAVDTIDRNGEFIKVTPAVITSDCN